MLEEQCGTPENGRARTRPRIAHDFNNILTGIMGNWTLPPWNLAPTHAVQARLQDAQQPAVVRATTWPGSSRSAGATRETRCQVARPGGGRGVQLLRASLPVTIEIRTRLSPQLPGRPLPTPPRCTRLS